MPGRAVHPHLAFFLLKSSTLPLVILSGEIGPRSGTISESKDLVSACVTRRLKRAFRNGRRLIPAHNNPVIAQDLDIFDRSPKTSSRTLPCPRMAYEKIRFSIPANNSSAVQFDRLLLGKPVHDQEFVEGILERFCVPREIQKRLPTHLQHSRTKTAIYPKPLVGLIPKPRRYKIKLETIFG